MFKDAFVKIPRELYSDKYFSNFNSMKIIMYLYYYTRFLPGFVDGIHVDIGQALISVNMFSHAVGIPESTIRSVLSRLEKDGFVKMERVNKKYRLITLTNYNKQPAPSTMLKGYSGLSEDEEE